MGSCLSGDGSRGGDARGGQTSDNERGRQQDQRSDESTVRPPPTESFLYPWNVVHKPRSLLAGQKQGRLIYVSAVAVQLPAIFQRHAY